MKDVQYYSGRVNAVLYEDSAQGFYIVKMLMDGQDSFSIIEDGGLTSVIGHIPGMVIQTGTWLGFEAKWEKHAKYGKQLAITKAPVLKGSDWTPDQAERMLVANGVGERLLMRVRAQTGDDQFLDILSDQDALQKVEGVSEFAALHVVQRWQATRAYFKTLAFLNQLDLPTGRVRSIWSTFGDDAEKVLSENPWALVRVEGITFEQADEIAGRLGLSPDNPLRAQGAMLHVCRAQRNMGNLFLTVGQVASGIRATLGQVDPQAVAQALKTLTSEGQLVRDKETRPGTSAVYEPWPHHMEVESAELLRSRAVTAGFGPGGLDADPFLKKLASVGPKTAAMATKGSLARTVTTAVNEWGSLANLKLSQTQKKGVANALSKGVSVLTGLPGTGKTTSLRAVVNVLQDAGVVFLLCAPTGIAAKRLSHLAGAPAHTIHRALSAKGQNKDNREATYAGFVGDREREIGAAGEGEFWGFDHAHPHPAEVVIVDESSMVDQHLLFRLLTCTSPQCRVVFVGDAAQLPSVGPGNVLRDIAGCDEFPVVNLTEIFRQADTSSIVPAAHAIHRGEVPECDPPGDFVLLRISDESKVLHTVLSLAEKLYDKRLEFQILSPRHAGTVGVTNLNARLRELLNPRSPGLTEVRLGGDTLREDDRVMIVKNDYKMGVFNGDVGKIVRIDQRAKEVEVKIFGEPPLHVRIPFKSAGRLLRMAYAMTVHKAQGMEYDNIVMPVVDSFHHQLQRNLLYTAITRARKRVFLVGTHTALVRAVLNNKEDQRNTLLRDRLHLPGGSGQTKAG